MPADLARHIVTETPRIAAALDAAARVWPESSDDPSELLRRLIKAGHAAIALDRRELIRTSAGAASGMYPPNAAATLRDEWPD